MAGRCSFCHCVYRRLGGCGDAISSCQPHPHHPAPSCERRVPFCGAFAPPPAHRLALSFQPTAMSALRQSLAWLPAAEMMRQRQPHRIPVWNRVQELGHDIFSVTHFATCCQVSSALRCSAVSSTVTQVFGLCVCHHAAGVPPTGPPCGQ